MKKRVLAVILGAVMTMSLAACGSSDAGKTSSNDGEKSYTIGISQFAEHGSLDNCREGFLEGLKEEGIEEGKNLTVEVKNAAADQGTAKQISDGFVSDKVDLVCAIATPSAQAAYNSAMNSDIPVVYTAVTDPVAAKLAKEDGTPAGNVTGTSDELPIKAQLEMIREMLPDAKNIGILYTTSEANSVSALAKYKELAADYGFTIVDKGIAQMKMQNCKWKLVLHHKITISVFHGFGDHCTFDITAVYEEIFKVTISTCDDRLAEKTCDMDTIFLIIDLNQVSCHITAIDIVDHIFQFSISGSTQFFLSVIQKLKSNFRMRQGKVH